MILRAENIRKVFKKKVVIEDSTVEFETGQIATIVGGNGSGKTTLIQCLAGVYTLSGGHLYIDQQLVDPDTAAYKRNIVLSFQESMLNTSLTPEIAIYRWAKFYNTNLSRSVIRDWFDRLKIAEDDRGKRIHTLSGGTKKKLELIKTFVADASFFIFDEPFAALDKDMKSLIKDLFREMKQKGKSLILVTHDNSLAEMSDKIYTIKNKRIVEGFMNEEIIISAKSITDEILKDMVQKEIIISGEIMKDQKPEVDMDEIARKFNIPIEKMKNVQVIHRDGKSADEITKKLGINKAKIIDNSASGITIFKKIKLTVKNKSTDLLNILNYFNDNGVEYKDINM